MLVWPEVFSTADAMLFIRLIALIGAALCIAAIIYAARHKPDNDDDWWHNDDNLGA